MQVIPFTTYHCDHNCARWDACALSHQTSGSFSWRCWSPVVVACPLGRPRLALASRRPELAVVLVVRSFHCTYSLLWLWLEPLLHFSAVEFSRCLHCRAHRHGLQRSPGRSQAPLLSATVAATGVRSSSPTPLPKRGPHRRASQPVRGSVARELSGMMLGAVSGSASKCCPPLLPESMRLSGSSTSTLPATCGPGRGVAGPSARNPPSATGLARVFSSVAAPARQRWLG